MFSVNTRETKAELLRRTNEMQTSLMKKLEESIQDLFNQSIDRYGKMHKMIDRKLNTPDDLVEMEKIKNNLSSDLSNIQRDFDDAMKIYIFLFQSDHFFSDYLLNKTEETIKRHLKYRRDSEE
jgi:hypothetical protein